VQEDEGGHTKHDHPHHSATKELHAHQGLAATQQVSGMRRHSHHISVQSKRARLLDLIYSTACGAIMVASAPPGDQRNVK
jgi:hypothetical protein